MLSQDGCRSRVYGPVVEDFSRCTVPQDAVVRNSSGGALWGWRTRGKGALWISHPVMLQARNQSRCSFTAWSQSAPI